jgi:hypothetical protein
MIQLSTGFLSRSFSDKLTCQEKERVKKRVLITLFLIFFDQDPVQFGFVYASPRYFLILLACNFLGLNSSQKLLEVSVNFVLCYKRPFLPAICL